MAYAKEYQKRCDINLEFVEACMSKTDDPTDSFDFAEVSGPYGDYVRSNLPDTKPNKREFLAYLTANLVACHVKGTGGGRRWFGYRLKDS
jgi:hypothetical protein